MKDKRPQDKPCSNQEDGSYIAPYNVFFPDMFDLLCQVMLCEYVSLFDRYPAYILSLVHLREWGRSGWL